MVESFRNTAQLGSDAPTFYATANSIAQREGNIICDHRERNQEIRPRVSSSGKSEQKKAFFLASWSSQTSEAEREPRRRLAALTPKMLGHNLHERSPDGPGTMSGNTYSV